MARENNASHRLSLDASISMELRMNAVGFTAPFLPVSFGVAACHFVGDGLVQGRVSRVSLSGCIVACVFNELKNPQLDISTIRLRWPILLNFNTSNDVSGTLVGLLSEPSDGNAPSGVTHHVTRTHREGACGRPTSKRMD